MEVGVWEIKWVRREDCMNAHIVRVSFSCSIMSVLMFIADSASNSSSDSQLGASP